MIPEKILLDTVVELLRVPLASVPHSGAGAMFMSGFDAAMHNVAGHKARQLQQRMNIRKAFIYLPCGNKIAVRR
jgi:hypothetical protein